MTLPHSATAADTAPFDLILRGGAVIDGTGTPPRPGDIGVRGDRVVALGDLGDAPANRVLDIPGCFVCPGFIDIHTHSDISVLFTPGMESSLRQGVTTEVVGNCGFSLCLAQGGSENPDFTWEQGLLRRGGITLDWSDLPGFARRIEESGVAINVATLVGHGTLRKRAMGLAERKPDADEMRTMQADLAAALEAGAVGLSSGLEYVPGMYADIAEMTPLAKLAGEAGKFYATHLRDEGDFLEEAVAEAIAVAEASGTPLQLSHHKAERPRNWGKVARTLAQVDAAQARGTDILLDQYPYTAYQTNLATIVLPAWAMGGTPDALAEKLRDPAVRERVRAAMEGVDYRSVEIAAYGPFRDYQGRTVAEIAESAGQDPRDWLLDLFSVGESFASAVHHALSEEDVERVLSDGRVIIGSDAVANSPASPFAADRPHPRSCGTFARVLARYVRERKLLTWEEAIRRMTSLPASRLGFTDRGRLAPGCIADIVVFDPNAVTDQATFTDPLLPPIGIEYVLVSGTLAVANGILTGARAGRVLR